MALSKIDNDLGAFVLLNGPTSDRLTRSFWANNAEQRKQLLNFGVMPGLLFDEDGKRVVEPLLTNPAKLTVSVTGIQQEICDAKPLTNCVNLMVRIEQKLANIKPVPNFEGTVNYTNILTPGAHLIFSYNLKTKMGGIALNNRNSLVTSQDYWKTRTADGWLIQTTPPKEEEIEVEQSTTAW